MSQPPAYNRTADFTQRDGNDTDHAALNAELDGAALSVNAIRSRLGLIQRDDGALANNSVGAEQMSPTATAVVADQLRAHTDAASASATSAAGSATNAATSATNAANSAGQAALFDGPWLADVAALLANTSLTYTTGTSSSVAVGSFVRTRAEGFVYQVAAAGATDQHITTAGGVKLYVLPSVRGFNIRAFGATDGGNASAALNIAHAALPSRGGHVFWPSGVYVLDENHVFTKPITFIGEGCSATAGGQAATRIEKASSVSGPVVDFRALCSGIESVGFEGQAGNAGDGVQISAGRFRIINCSVHNMGRDGVRIGDAVGRNCNLFTIDTLYARANGRHGLYIDDEGPDVATVGPNTNGGTVQKVETFANGEDGIRLYRSWYVTVIGDVPQQNSRIGLNIIGGASPNFVGSRYHTVVGGEQNEFNFVANIENSGFRCSFLGVQPGATFTDNGVGTLIVSSERTLFDGLTSTRPIVADRADGTTPYPLVVRNRGNASNGRGVGIELQTPNDSNTSRSSARVEAEQETTNNDYLQFALNKAGVMTDLLRLSALQQALLPLIDGNILLGSGALQFGRSFFSEIVVNKGPTVRSGAGSPEGNITAPVGSLYLRTDGGAGTSLYVKQSGTGSTGWAGK